MMPISTPRSIDDLSLVSLHFVILEDLPMVGESDRGAFQCGMTIPPHRTVGFWFKATLFNAITETLVRRPPYASPYRL